jgi:hypothetical protein
VARHRWEVAYDLATGRQHVLDTSTPAGDPFEPGPVVRNGVAAWAHKLSYPGRLDVLVVDLAKGSKRVLLSNVHVGQVALAGPRLVYALTGYAAGIYTNTMMSMPLAGTR